MIWGRESQCQWLLSLVVYSWTNICGQELARDYNSKEHPTAFKHAPSFNKLNLTLAVTNKICNLFAYPLHPHHLPCSCIFADRCLQTPQCWLGVLATLLSVKILFSLTMSSCIVWVYGLEDKNCLDYFLDDCSKEIFYYSSPMILICINMHFIVMLTEHL